MDTTRADALSCYGTPPDIQRPLPPVTPRLDALAAEGLRFDAFYAHAPTTLSSHTSMLTGLDPHEHGVPRNGFALSPAVPTLAERLSTAGYQTLGVVGASALDGEMGLGRGFSVWDDQLTQRFAVQFEDRAEGVVARTLEHVDDADPDRPLFLFVHVFDPHGPFAAPPPYGQRFVDPLYRGVYRRTGFRRKIALGALRDGRLTQADRDYIASLYLGEVAYADHHLGRLLDALQERGFLEHAVVVVTADHGEVLGEDPLFAWSHGASVTEGAIRVPLIVRGYGLDLGGPGVVTRQAGMASLAPTLERLAGLPRSLGSAPDLWPMLRPGPVHDRDGWPDRPTHAVFHEATTPHQKREDGLWNNLGLRRGVHAGGAAGRALKTAMPVRVVEGPAGLGTLLDELLAAWDAASPPFRGERLSSRTRRALKALGYLEEDTDRGLPQVPSAEGVESRDNRER